MALVVGGAKVIMENNQCQVIKNVEVSLSAKKPKGVF